MLRKIAGVVSPLVIIIICSISAVVLYKIMDKWIFIPMFFCYIDIIGNDTENTVRACGFAVLFFGFV
jgi:hypothetical protein